MGGNGKPDLFIILSYALVFLAGLFFPRNIEFYAEEAELPLLLLSGPEVLKSSFNIVAVNNQGAGSLGNVEVEVRHGEGRVLLNTNPFVETDTQVSIEIAKDVAEKVCGYSLSDKDVIVSFSIGSEGGVVGGHSAGAATTAALIAAVQGKELNNSVVVTGMIDALGNVGRIEGVIEKAQAVAGAGKELLLVPEGQGNLTYYEKEVVDEEVFGGFVFKRYQYTPKKFDVNNYTMTQWDLQVLEVSNIQEVLSYALKT
jgi:predicted S18 family serine protease